jgi:hypothetical protein
VKQIRCLYAKGHRQTAIAGKFGVHQSQISRICSGKRWGHLIDQEKQRCR